MTLIVGLVKFWVQALGGAPYGSNAITMFLRYQGFELVDEIRGGTVSVFAIENTEGQKFVGKFAVLEQTHRGRAKFHDLLREVKVFNNLKDHPLFVTMMDSFVFEDVFCVIVMEHCLGDLFSFAKQYPVFPEKNSFSLDTIACICAAVVKALKHLNGLGLIHGDIKPGNILISQSMFPKLCDFGTCHEWMDRFKRPKRSFVFGTFPFIPGEASCIKSNKILDASVDTFSLGVSMTFLLAGAYPFKGNVLQTEVAIRDFKEGRYMLLPELQPGAKRWEYPNSKIASYELWRDFRYALRHMLIRREFRLKPAQLSELGFFAEAEEAWNRFLEGEGQNPLIHVMESTPSYADAEVDEDLLDDMLGDSMFYIVEFALELQDALTEEEEEPILRTPQELELLATDLLATENVAAKINDTLDFNTRQLMRGICFHSCCLIGFLKLERATLCVTWLGTLGLNSLDDPILCTSILTLLENLSGGVPLKSGNESPQKMSYYYSFAPLQPPESIMLKSILASSKKMTDVSYTWMELRDRFASLDQRRQIGHASSDLNFVQTQWRYKDCLLMVLKAIEIQLYS